MKNPDIGSQWVWNNPPDCLQINKDFPVIVEENHHNRVVVRVTDKQYLNERVQSAKKNIQR